MKAPYDYKVGMEVYVPNDDYYTEGFRDKVCSIMEVDHISIKIGLYDSDYNSFTYCSAEDYGAGVTPIPITHTDYLRRVRSKKPEVSSGDVEAICVTLSLPKGTKSYYGEITDELGRVFKVNIDDTEESLDVTIIERREV